MLTMLKEYAGNIEINGTSYKNVNDAIKRFKSDDDTITIKLSHSREEREKTQISQSQSVSEKKITVKKYMTMPATPEFDFMEKWNNNIPMPLRTMIGTVEKETRGMVYMKLHGDITSERTMRCLMCGRPITNPVSQYFGMGPECGGHNYVNPFYNDEELKAAVNEYRKKLQNMTWEGWIIKSAILEEEDVLNEKC